MNTQPHHSRPSHHRFSGPALRLGNARRRLIYLLLSVLFITGAVWLALKFGRSPDDLPGSWPARVMQIHGAATMGLLFLSGTMLFQHMLTAWALKKNRKTGVILASVLLLLVISGWGLYYLGDENWRQGDEWMHWGAGALVCPLLWLHIATGRQRRRQRVHA
ncbi:hypothetical protein KSF73_14605 [Burkholderiaceae bacterium DAT-1]|nr:hypothetical protein [Burkholderiaceae bacterium DAT-1]